MSSKKDLLRDKMKALSTPTAIKPMSLDDTPVREIKPNAEATTNDTANAVAEVGQAENTDEMRLNYDEFTLPHPNPTTDLKGKRYQKGDPLHTERYSFQITEELKENLDYYMEYAKRHGLEINQSVLLREALVKALKKEPRG